MTVALAFPGWGAQYPGMARKLLDEHRAARETLAEASEYAGLDLVRLCSSGSIVELGTTLNALLSVFVMGLAHHRVLRALGGPRPAFVLGHSVGEYTALVCAGALSLQDGVRVIAVRAALGERVLKEAAPAVTVLKNTDEAVVSDACARASVGGGKVFIACMNSHSQFLVAGETQPVLAVEELVLDAAPRAEVVPLIGAAAFHTPLMAAHAAELAAALASCTFKDPECPIIQNIGAQPTTDKSIIISRLVEQLHSPVDWRASVARLRREGAPQVIELGPRSILKALFAELHYPSPVYSFDDRRSREAFLSSSGPLHAEPR